MANLVKETQVLYDARGKKSHVVIPYDKYQKLLEQLEDTEDIKAIKQVMYEKTTPWTEVKKELRKKRRS